ncbi:hypothetical protein XELAEV_18034137mg [Xenopus laevis]|uniref:Uncharacterized protein n=1 Tax=Xenopus laevis TaxID=8355 RepID=A0A974CLN4_XENLA|nr:hypothetical protein XELAEV_18034137mg [Xenopus laevis]
MTRTNIQIQNNSLTRLRREPGYLLFLIFTSTGFSSGVLTANHCTLALCIHLSFRTPDKSPFAVLYIINPTQPFAMPHSHAQLWG